VEAFLVIMKQFSTQILDNLIDSAAHHTKAVLQLLREKKTSNWQFFYFYIYLMHLEVDSHHFIF
jgi:hypothetical protein